MQISNLALIKLMKVFKNNLAKNDMDMGHSFFYPRQNTGSIWHTAVRPSVRPSVHASYDNISHLFPLLLIGHVVRYIVLIKGGASERCDFSQFGKRQFSYGIYN